MNIFDIIAAILANRVRITDHADELALDGPEFIRQVQQKWQTFA